MANKNFCVSKHIVYLFFISFLIFFFCINLLINKTNYSYKSKASEPDPEIGEIDCAKLTKDDIAKCVDINTFGVGDCGQLQIYSKYSETKNIPGTVYFVNDKKIYCNKSNRFVCCVGGDYKTNMKKRPTMISLKTDSSFGCGEQKFITKNKEKYLSRLLEDYFQKNTGSGKKMAEIINNDKTLYNIYPNSFENTILAKNIFCPGASCNPQTEKYFFKDGNKCYEKNGKLLSVTRSKGVTWDSFFITCGITEVEKMNCNSN